MTGTGPSTQPYAGAERPGVLRLAVALTAVAGLALVAYGAFLAGHWLTERPAQPVNAALLVVLSVGWGVALLGCARGLLRGRRWAVAPVVTSGLLLLAVGWLLAGGHDGEVFFGWVVVGLSVTCLGSVLAAAKHLS